MKKTILLLFLLLAGGLELLSQAQQCIDLCKYGPFKKDIMDDDIIFSLASRDIEELEDAYEEIDEVMVNEGRAFLRELKMGVGCFFYYYAFAKMIAIAEENSRFREYLYDVKRLDEEKYRKDALQALGFAETILETYKENFCTDEIDKIRGKKDRDQNNIEIYKNDLKKIREILQPESRDDPPIPIDENDSEKVSLEIIQISFVPEKPRIGETVRAIIEIVNKGEQKLETPIQINWYPNTSDRGNVETSPDIVNILPNASVPIQLSYQYSQVGSFQTVVELTAESIGGLIGLKSTNITIRNDKGTTERQSKMVGVYLNQNGEVSISPPKTIYDSPPCMILNREFKVGDFNTSSSIEIDSLALKETLAPFINQRKNILNTLYIEITGYADKRTISGKYRVPTFLGIIKEEPYFSLNDSTLKYMTLGTFFNRNEHLAFIRAYILKKKILEWLGSDLNPNQIILRTQRKFDKNNSSRGATIQICSDEFTGNDMTQLYDKALAEIGGEGEPEPEPINPVVINPTKADDQSIVRKGPKVEEEKINPPTPELKKDEVTIKGLKKKELKVGQTIRIEQIQFKANEAILTNESLPTLDEISNFLKVYPDVVVEIGGHTNNHPTHEICDKLSRERAEAVKEYLIKNGIRNERLSPKGYGKRNPIASNKTLAGRKKNQRVEIKILAIDNR